MFKHLLKIAVRNFWKHKTFSLINVFGLAVGMAGSLILFIWIQNQLSIDRFHKDAADIYKVYANESTDGSIRTREAVPVPFIQTLHQQPEVSVIARAKTESLVLSHGETKLKKTGMYVDPAFLEIFNFPVITGNNGFQSNAGVLITQKLERSFFDNENGIGKIITIGTTSYKVAGILKDLPNNTQFAFDFLLPWQSLSIAGFDNTSWNSSVSMYARLKSGTDVSLLNARVAGISARPGAKAGQETYFLYSFPRTWLYGQFENGKPTGGPIKLIRMIGVIAIILLLIACINFINLGTARSLKRAKEVGLRKVIGGSKRSLIWQFICESMLVAFIGGLIGLAIVMYALPYFNQITEKQLAIDFSSVAFWLAFSAFIVITGFLAGLYPAFFLSSFMPVKALKGIFETRSRFLTPGRILFIFQFTIAVVLINFVIIVQKQVDHLKTRELGYQKENLVYHPLNDDLKKNYTALRDELLKSGKVAAVALSNTPITKAMASSANISWKGIRKEDEKTDFSILVGKDQFLATNGLKLVAGRELTPAESNGEIKACVINETAAQLFHFTNPVDQFISIDDTKYLIVGVVKDFLTASPLQAVDPVIIKGGDENKFINIRMRSTGNYSANLLSVSSILKQYNPNEVTELQFADQDYDQKIKGLNLTSTLANIFATLTIIISCLGLLGLVMYKTETKAKEIGIRKVFGATALSISALLSKSFLKMVGLSILIGSPIAWLLMSSFLRPLYYRASLNISILLEGAGLALLVTIITISTQSLKASLSNPVKSLRDE